jgi:putative membrane protein
MFYLEEEQEEDGVALPLHAPFSIASNCCRALHLGVPGEDGTWCRGSGYEIDPFLQIRKLAMKFISLAIIATLTASPAFAAGKPSQTFLKKAIEGNYAEIQMGKLAQQNGQNQDVKRFGQMLSDDHSAANQKAMDAAKSLGVPAPGGPSAKQKAEYEKMSKVNGARFDREFAKHMVTDHKKDLAEYKKETKQSDAAGDYAKAQIDVLQKHLDTAKSLETTKSSGR